MDDSARDADTQAFFPGILDGTALCSLLYRSRGGYCCSCSHLRASSETMKEGIGSERDIRVASRHSTIGRSVVNSNVGRHAFQFNDC
jgi:hypothetical protein